MMDTFYTIVMITIWWSSMVVAVNKDFYNNYETICSKRQNNAFEYLLNKIQDKSQMCDHSQGFYYSSDNCPKQYSGDGVLSSRSYYRSDNDLYYYFYVHFKQPIKDYQNNGKDTKSYKLVIDNNLLHFKRNYLRDKYLFVVWIREPSFNELSTHTYEVIINSSAIQTTVTSDSFDYKLEDQLIFKDFKKTQDLNVVIKVMGSTNNITKYTINQSYVIFCNQKNKPIESVCQPIVVDDHYITCKCSEVENYYRLIVVTAFWIIWLLLVIKPFIDLFMDSEQRSKVDIKQAVNCNDKSFKFKYEYVMRLTKETLDPLNNVTIDLEFFTDNHESVAPSVRLSADNLDDKPVMDITITQWRLTKLPKLKYIECNHSGSLETKIKLLYIKIDCKFGGKESITFTVMKNIIKNSRRFYFQEPKDLSENDIKIPSTTFNFGISNIYLSYLEIMWILFVDISLMALFVDIFRNIFDNTISPIISIQLLFQLLSATGCLIVIHIILVIVYKCLLLCLLKQQRRMQSETIFYCIIIVFYVLTTFTAVCICCYLSINILSLIDIYQWVSIIICGTGILCLLWYLSSKLKPLFWRNKPNITITETNTNSISSLNDESITT
ncbi:uncharacterized protein LOC128964066 [Oppia nitens]|uniref:uncharacterized protein LOC128964066 n=1 Tax=Oppia nitens TaxID=1686743 RepID=UPI0023DBA8FB|nr:uncharacterized protein LOC128964066 [Oppia nitens]